MQNAEFYEAYRTSNDTIFNGLGMERRDVADVRGNIGEITTVVVFHPPPCTLVCEFLRKFLFVKSSSAKRVASRLRKLRRYSIYRL